MRNLSNKVPKEKWQKIKAELESLKNSLDYKYVSFTRCLLEDSEALLNIFKIPYRHRINVRSTNLIEMVFVEERRRTKIISQFLTEEGCLKLVFSVLWQGSFRWQRDEYEKI